MVPAEWGSACFDLYRRGPARYINFKRADRPLSPCKEKRAAGEGAEAAGMNKRALISYICHAKNTLCMIVYRIVSSDRRS